jgi:hypothetical protein
MGEGRPPARALFRRRTGTNVGLFQNHPAWARPGRILAGRDRWAIKGDVGEAVLRCPLQSMKGARDGRIYKHCLNQNEYNRLHFGILQRMHIVPFGKVSGNPTRNCRLVGFSVRCRIPWSEATNPKGRARGARGTLVRRLRQLPLQHGGSDFMETNKHYYSSKICVRPASLKGAAARVGYWIWRNGGRAEQ